jgi:CO/xanthine dehydrogenase Mo-binding subunit
VSSAHERGQVQQVRVGFDDDGRLLGLDVGSGTTTAPTCRTASSSRSSPRPSCSGRTSPGAYRVEFWSLYTNTVIVTPYRGAGRPQGVYAMERTMDAIADHLGKDRVAVREANFIQPDEMPYDQQMTFQDGRPLDLRLRRLPGVDGQAQGAGRLGRLRAYREQARSEGRRVGIGVACYVEGTGVGPYEGGHVQVETSGKVIVATGLTTQGQGHATVFAQIVADELGVPFEDVTVTTGDTRRMPYSVGTFASAPR